MESGQADSGLGYQSGQSCYEVQRLENHMASAVAQRGLPFIAHLINWGERQASLGYCRPGDIAAQALQVPSLVCLGVTPRPLRGFLSGAKTPWYLFRLILGSSARADENCSWFISAGAQARRVVCSPDPESTLPSINAWPKYWSQPMLPQMRPSPRKVSVTIDRSTISRSSMSWACQCEP